MVDEDLALSGVVRSRARHYLAPGSTGDVDVTFRGAVVRPWSRIDRYRLRTQHASRMVLVKRALDGPAPSTARGDEARLVPNADPGPRLRLEYEALRAVAADLESGDGRIGTVPVLDWLDQGAIVMGEVRGTPLSRLLAHVALTGSRRVRALEPVLANAGLWLRRFQRLEGLAETGTRHETRDEVAAAIDNLAAFLAQSGEDRRLLEAIAERGRAAAERHLPEALPMGLAHGDFAPRNVLVEGDDRVTVLDTRARWRAPIWEDVAMLLVSLRAAPPRMLASPVQPPNRLLPLETAFLEARFEGETIHRDAIKVFELVVLLDRWSARIPVGRPGWLRRKRLSLVRGRYARLASAMLGEL